jgi:hypothetical protein
MILIADDNQEMRRMIRDLVADLDPKSSSVPMAAQRSRPTTRHSPTLC